MPSSGTVTGDTSDRHVTGGIGVLDLVNTTKLFAVLSVAIAHQVVPSDAFSDAGQSDAGPLPIGSKLELFVDDYLIDKMSGGLSLMLHSPRPAEVALRFEKPWEGRRSYYFSTFRDGDRFRMYYRGGWGEKGIPAQVCYAESTDGIHWTKPELGLIEFEGSKNNNIVWNGVGSPVSLGVFKDTNPACSPEHRYKALASRGYKTPVYALGSPNGLSWQLIQNEPVIAEYDGAAAAYDSHFCTRWDAARKRYAVYHRIWYRPVDGKVRNIAVRTSEDFIKWTPLQRLDFGDTPFEHLYTNAIGPYFRAPHILLGFPKRFQPGRKRIAEDEYSGISDAVFISSRDGVHFDRRFMQAFVRPGRDRLNWLNRSNMVAPRVLETGPDEISIYVSQHYSHLTAHLRRFVLRTDGFASVHATYSGGELLTKPFTFEGTELVLNYASSAAGSIQVEIQDAAGKPHPDYTLVQCPAIFGDEIEQVVSWTKRSNVEHLAVKPVRLRFVMKDADLYSMRFRTP